MKTKKQLPLRMACIIFIITVSITASFGQEKSIQNRLMSQDWVGGPLKPDSSMYAGWRFTKTELIHFIDQKYKGEIRTSEAVSEYYLSDTKNVGPVFDRSKVGKSKTGKYIVYSFNYGSDIRIEEIVEFSDSVLTSKDLTGKEPGFISTLKARAKTKYNNVPANITKIIIKSPPLE